MIGGGIWLAAVAQMHHTATHTKSAGSICLRGIPQVLIVSLTQGPGGQETARKNLCGSRRTLGLVRINVEQGFSFVTHGVHIPSAAGARSSTKACPAAPEITYPTLPLLVASE